MENSTFNPGNGSTASTAGSAGILDADGMPGTLNAGADLNSADVQSTVNKVATPAHDAVDRFSSVAHQAVDKLASGVTSVTGRVSDQARKLSDTAPRVMETSKSWVQEKPLEAVGIALAVGYIMGRLRSN